MKDPAFLFYSDRFVSGVQTMNFEDRGKYITLLALMHQQGRMDEETIRFLVGNLSDKLKSKFIQDEKGLWYNETLEIEAEKRKNFVESRVNNGKLGGRPKEDNKPNGKPKINLKHKLPVIVDVIVYFNSKGYSKESAEKFFNFYSEADWKDSNGKIVLNWKQKAISVWFKDENKIKEAKTQPKFIGL